MLLCLEALPSSAAGIGLSEYRFELVATQRVDRYEEFNPQDPQYYFFEENITQLDNEVFGIGELVFVDNQVFVPGYGNVLTSTVDIDFLGSDAYLFPGLGSQINWYGSSVSFVNGPNGPELVGVNVDNIGITSFLSGSLDGVTFAETWQFSDEFYSSFTETTGFIRFNSAVHPSQLKVVPEPLTILGSLTAICLGATMKKRMSNE